VSNDSGLIWMWSQMSWSQKNGLKWLGLNSHGTREVTTWMRSRIAWKICCLCFALFSSQLLRLDWEEQISQPKQITASALWLRGSLCLLCTSLCARTDFVYMDCDCDISYCGPMFAAALVTISSTRIERTRHDDNVNA